MFKIASSNYYLKSFFWSTLSKIVHAIVQFVSVPLLLSYFGKSNYGLITLAISVNAYMQLLDMGVNTGAVKYFSEWIDLKKYNLIDSVARTSISFYGFVGLINAIILVIISFYGMSLFAITAQQVGVLRNMFLILSLFSILNWSSSVFNQLLTANEELYFVQQVNTIRSILSLIVIGITIVFEWDILLYFFWFTFVNTIVFIPFYIRSKRQGLVKSFIPAREWKEFLIIFRYSVAIVAMAIFQVSAVKLRPIILSIFSSEGTSILSDYRIMETLTLFVISIGGVFISIFLPKTSKLLIKGDYTKVASFTYTATRYTSIICVCLTFPFIICGTEIFSLYVGQEYIYLKNWLSLWMLMILFSLHNSPVSSLVLSSGKTKMLVYSSALACIISLIVNAILCSGMGVGSAVIGFSIYIIIQMSFYYFYFNNKILKLNSWKVFKSFIIPVLLGTSVALLLWKIDVRIDNLFLLIIIKSGIWLLLYALLLVISKVVNLKEVKQMLKK